MRRSLVGRGCPIAAALAVAGSVVLGAGATRASEPAGLYQMNPDFDLSANPNGPWSYLEDGKPLAFKILHFPGTTSVRCWWSDKPIPDSIVVCRNFTGTTQGTVNTVRFPVHYLLFDPENHIVTVRWTAPVSGSYEILGDFLGADIYQVAHPVSVALNGTQTLFSKSISQYGERLHFKRVVNAMAGDTVDFETRVGRSYTNLATGVRAKITLLSGCTPFAACARSP